MRAEPILVMCVRAVHLQAWEVRLQYRTFFGNNENNDDFNLLILLAQKWSILANFGKKTKTKTKNQFWGITWKVLLGLKTMFKS